MIQKAPMTALRSAYPLHKGAFARSSQSGFFDTLKPQAEGLGVFA